MSEFRLNLTLIENEVLQSMVRMACFNQVSLLLAGFQEQVKDYHTVGGGPAARRKCADPGAWAIAEPSLERVQKETFAWFTTLQRLTEDLRMAYRQGLTVVTVGRSEFEALFTLAHRDWSRHDGSVEAMAFCMAAEACKIGILAALEAARIHLDRQTVPTNVFAPLGPNKN